MDSIKMNECDENSLKEFIAETEDFASSLGEDDIQCGYVAYNNKSYVLKYTCSFCEKTYDDIEYFCRHLSEHMNTELDKKDEHAYYKQDEYNFVRENGAPFGEHNPGPLTKNSFSLDADNKTEEEYEDFGYLKNAQECGDSEIHGTWEETDNYSTLSDMFIEQIDDVYESVPETNQKSADRFKSNEKFSLLDQNISGNDVKRNIDENFEQTNHNKYRDKSDNHKTFNECFIKETMIESKRTNEDCNFKCNVLQTRRFKFQDMLRLKRKRKKVTTVKVIAVKNRITEIYERIKKQQAESQSILKAHNLLPHDYCVTSSNTNLVKIEEMNHEGTESNATEQNIEGYALKDEGGSVATKELETIHNNRSKIIGETLITLIPEGTKVPKTLPAPIEKTESKTIFSDLSKNLNTTLIKNTNNDKRAVCPACGKIFRSHFSLTIHKRIHYLESDSAVKLAHKCSDCDQLFNKLSQLKQHVEAVHYPEGFVCKICNRRLSSLSLLERHMLRVHLDRPFNCQECGKNFSDPVTFEKHIISHTSGEVYKCHICGRKYSTEYFLDEHLRNHKEQTPQTCVVCGKVTLRITQHMKIHTPRPKRLLSCSVCGKVFNFSSGLSHHFKIMHKLPRPPPKPKKEPRSIAQKRKRKPRVANKKNKRNSYSITHNATPYTNSCGGDIIEEPSEIPDEVYDEEEAQTLLNLAASAVQEQGHESTTNQEEGKRCHKNNIDHILYRSPLDKEDVIHKEEEAKRVIVELIQNSSYTSSLFSDNLSSVLEVTPPIAREETISAVNSIVHNR